MKHVWEITATGKATRSYSADDLASIRGTQLVVASDAWTAWNKFKAHVEGDLPGQGWTEVFAISITRVSGALLEEFS